MSPIWGADICAARGPVPTRGLRFSQHPVSRLFPPAPIFACRALIGRPTGLELLAAPPARALAGTVIPVPGASTGSAERLRKPFRESARRLTNHSRRTNRG